MKCLIVQNGGFIFLILLLYMIVANSVKQEHSLTVREFCFGNLLIHNIEPGEPYVLTLKSDQSADVNKLYHKHYKRKCRQEFKTSDSSGHFEISITNMNIPSCLNNSCWCNFFEISVSGHSKRFCGTDEDFFSSKSDKLIIDFHPEYEKAFDVTLTFTVQRNFYIITGAPTDASMHSTVIETPYFPKPYTPNYRAEYILRSNILGVHVMLLFMDFLISHQSFIEVTGHNGTSCVRFYGSMFRPPPIVSHSNELSMKFKSNDQGDMPGFSAEVWFIKSVDKLFVPFTDCGGLKYESDGSLHVKTQEEFRLYDCIWHIMPSFMATKSNLSVFIHLRHVGHKSNLEFRQGRYSKSNIVGRIDCESINCTILDIETVIPSTDFLYIRFKGYLEMHSVVNMSYNTYHVGNCSNSEFRCNDGRCLKSGFHCDDIKQCPDGSDEDNCQYITASGITEEGVLIDHDVQTEDYIDTVPTKFFWFAFVGTIGLVVVLATVFVFFYSRCKQATPGQLLPEQSVGGELSGAQPTLYPVDSCGCDNPPSYEDFIKSSDNYPHILYIRPKQCFIPSTNCTQGTTSFCNGARVRHHSADYFNAMCSDDSDIFLNVTEESSHATQSVGSNRCNIEINHIIKSSTNVKKAYSLDSKLNDVNKDSCNLCLSIMHPVCAHMPNNHLHLHYYTLPTNFKINACKSSSNNGHKVNTPASYQSNSTVNFSKDRRSTWSFVPHASVGSEIVTIVKTRCCSDPCKGISVHCSLY